MSDLDGMAGALARALASRSNVMQTSGKPAIDWSFSMLTSHDNHMNIVSLKMMKGRRRRKMTKMKMSGQNKEDRMRLYFCDVTIVVVEY